MGRSVTVRVPATSANLGAGFDTLGIALDITAEVRVTLHEGRAPAPRSRAEQLALAAARSVFIRAGRTAPTELQTKFEGNIPVGRGLGASAVLRVGAVVGANQLLGAPLDPEEILLLASELEGHADNVAPALFGGFQVVVWDEGVLTHVQVPVPVALQAVVLVPDLDMPTSESRRLLPMEVTRHEAIHNVGRAALLVAAMATGRMDALRVATQDVLHQPARAQLFPALYDVIEAAAATGAACAYLSGGGSAVLALTTERADEIGVAMLAAARHKGIGGRFIVTRIRDCGAQIVGDEAWT